LARARAQLAQAQNDAGRAKTLIENKAISSEEFDARTSGVAQARAAVQSAQALLQQGELELSWTQVRAPIAGRVGIGAVTMGNTVIAGQTELTTLVSLDPIYVSFEGDEQTYLRYADLARNGKRESPRDSATPVRIGLANELSYPHHGEMVMIDNALNPTTGTIRARAILDNSEGRFTPGMFARVQLLGSNKRPALLIHEQAVLTDQDRKYVYVATTLPDQPSTLALRKDIQLGGNVDGLRIVTAGLEAGDQVIVNGMRKIFFPGAPVVPVLVPMDAPNIVAPPPAVASESTAAQQG
jgi:multidrug efflux system membrane fusion protein